MNSLPDIPKPIRGMLVELHGGHKDGMRVPYQGRTLTVPVLSIPLYEPKAESLSNGIKREKYKLTQSIPDGHWVYVLDINR